jgi:hypothetical protein
MKHFNESVNLDFEEMDFHTKAISGSIDHIIRNLEQAEYKNEQLILLAYCVKDINSRLGVLFSAIKGSSEGNKNIKVKEVATTGYTIPHSSLFVCHGDNGEIIRIERNGDFYFKGKLIDNDKQVVEAFRDFLRSQGYIWL